MAEYLLVYADGRTVRGWEWWDYRFNPPLFRRGETKLSAGAVRPECPRMFEAGKEPE
jgi:hypothetical protein